MNSKARDAAGAEAGAGAQSVLIYEADAAARGQLAVIFEYLNYQTVCHYSATIGVAEEVCHRIGIIQRGRLIACGTMADLYAQAQTKQGNLESVFLELTQDNPADAVQPE